MPLVPLPPDPLKGELRYWKLYYLNAVSLNDFRT